MKAILMSIKPKWVEKIASGEKTVEVRKTAPKCGAQLEVSDKVFEAINKISNKSLEMLEEALKKRTEHILNSLINMLELRVAVDDEITFSLISRKAVLSAITGIGEVFGIQIKTVGKIK